MCALCLTNVRKSGRSDKSTVTSCQPYITTPKYFSHWVFYCYEQGNGLLWIRCAQKIEQVSLASLLGPQDRHLSQAQRRQVVQGLAPRAFKIRDYAQ